jgi:hypothetical protein
MAILKKITIITIILTFFISISSNSAPIEQIKAKIVYAVAHMLTQKDDIKIFTNDKEFDCIFSQKMHIKKAEDCTDADVIITNNIDNLSKKCLNCIIIVTNYRDFMRCKKAAGAIFWQKGRPNILLRRKRLTKMHIKITKEMENFLE